MSLFFRPFPPLPAIPDAALGDPPGDVSRTSCLPTRRAPPGRALVPSAAAPLRIARLPRPPRFTDDNGPM